MEPSIDGLIGHIKENVALISTKITTLMRTHTESHAARAQEHTASINKLTLDSTAAQTTFDATLSDINKQLTDKTKSSDEIIVALNKILIELGEESAKVEETNATVKTELHARIKELEDAATATAASLTEIDKQTVAVLNIFGSGSGDESSNIDDINDENAAKFDEQDNSQSSPPQYAKLSELPKDKQQAYLDEMNNVDKLPTSDRANAINNIKQRYKVALKPALKAGRRRSHKNKKSKSRKSRKYRK
jgi:hypothetical protein